MWTLLVKSKLLKVIVYAYIESIINEPDGTAKTVVYMLHLSTTTFEMLIDSATPSIVVL